MKSLLTDKEWKAFGLLSCRMSVENLTCDGECSQKKVAHRMRQIRKEWRILEKKVGCTVFPHDIPLDYQGTRSTSNRLLHKVISNCSECPFMAWEPDNGSSNNDGCATCQQMGKMISFYKHPTSIPEWCPLPFNKST